MTVKIVKMDIANYVNKVGKLVNQSTKYNVKLARVSITNLVLLLHLDKLAKWAANNLNDEEYDLITVDDSSSMNFKFKIVELIENIKINLAQK